MLKLLFGLSWVMPHSVLGLLGCWQGSFGRHRYGFIWSIVPHGLMWCLWRERNSRCFEDFERSIPDLKLFFFRTLRDWLFPLQNKSFPSFFDFLDSCNFFDFLDSFTPSVLGCFPFDFYISHITYQKKILLKLHDEAHNSYSMLMENDYKALQLLKLYNYKILPGPLRYL